MIQGDFDIFLQVLDGSGGIGHAGSNHKGVEDSSLLNALQTGWLLGC